MSFFDLFKSRDEKLNEAIQEDLPMWKLMCTGIVTSPDFFNMFPPKDEFVAMPVQKAWMLAAFYVVIASYNSNDNKQIEACIKIGKILEEADRGLEEPICPKIDVLMNMWDDIVKNCRSQIDYIRSIMGRIKMNSAIHALLWMFCQSFLKMMSDPSEKVNYNAGADFLYDNFMGLMLSSKVFKIK